MEIMHKAFKLLFAVFLAWGAMFSLSFRDGRTREVYMPPEEPQQGIGRHFVAAFGYLGRAVERYEQQ